MDLALIESIYRRVGGEFDYSEASSGEYDDDDSRTTYDTAMTKNGELNGPRRFVFSSDGSIHTRTYKDDQMHGLAIGVSSDYIYVFVYREGKHIFKLVFTPSGQEFDRYGSEKNCFTDLKVSTFLK